MKSLRHFGLTFGVAVLLFGVAEKSAQAGSLAASYFALGEGDADVGNNQGIGSVSTVIGAGLGPDGLPLVSAAGLADLHDVNATGEIEWWAPAFDTNVSVLSNPVYPTSISLPFTDNNMYTNTTVLGANGDDATSFLTAEFRGDFTVAATSSVDFSACSDDDEFVYLSGGVFGAGTDVVDNGGIHGVSCTSGNENAALLAAVAPGTYTLSVFYADRERTGAAFQLSSTLDLTPTPDTPEPGTYLLFVSGLTGLFVARRKRV